MSKFEQTAATQTLLDFLNSDITSSKVIFNKFLEIPDSKLFEVSSDLRNQERFVYIPGSKDKPLLIAHADTVWNGTAKSNVNPVAINDDIITSGTPGVGIGADDRAGCAIIWMLKDLGFGILITDGEERGMIGAYYATNVIGAELNSYPFMIQFDRMGSNDFKCYDVGTDEFREFISVNTGFVEPNRYSFTDICTLCTDICGVNFSVGYYNEHTSRESLNINEWYSSYSRVYDFIVDKQFDHFKLSSKSNRMRIPRN